MKFYRIMTNAGSLKSKKISLSPVQPSIIDYFNGNKVTLQEPVLIQAHYYKEDSREEDFVCAGNPQVVSEDFKNLVEELDPKAAQFFTTKSINCTTRKKYYLMHVTQVVFCLDRAHSKIFPGFAGNDESIAVGFVDSSKIPKGIHLFRLGEDTAKHYVSEEFYKEFRKRKLKGCLFDLRTFDCNN